MIIDADTHYCPRDIFDALPHPEFVDYFRDAARSQDLDKIWATHYNNVRDPAWPECSSRQDFAKLPLIIRQELADTLPINGLLAITDDLSQVHVDTREDNNPDLLTMAQSMRSFLKTDRALLNPHAPTMRMFYSTEINLANDIMTCWNRTTAEIMSTNDEFDANGWLALQDLQSSLRELDYLMEQEFFGLYMIDRPLWSFMPWYHKIFEICEQNRFPVYFHFSVIDSAPWQWKWDRNHRYELLANHWRNSEARWFINLAGMVTEGVFDRYPDLRIVIAEHGLDWIIHFRESMIQNGLVDPLPYLQKNVWFAVDIERPNFLAMADYIGWDRLLFSTDYPHTDPGGSNRFNDVDLLHTMLNADKITQQQFDLLTHQNYNRLKHRMS